MQGQTRTNLPLDQGVVIALELHEAVFKFKKLFNCAVFLLEQVLEFRALLSVVTPKVSVEESPNSTQSS